MIEHLAAQLEASGINYHEAIERFGDNDALYRRFALKFLDDPHFSELEEALVAKDADAAERAAHSLKGVAGNLSFEILYKQASSVNEALRKSDFEEARALMPELRKSYDAVVKALQQMNA